MFRHCETKRDAKKLYRNLAMYLHPDKGGDARLMNLLTKAYERTVEYLKVCQQAESFHEEMEQEQDSAQSAQDEWCDPDEKYPMAYENVENGDPRLCIIGDIMVYGFKHKSFDLGFCGSVAGYLDENDCITSSQYNSLRNIYYSFHIEEWLENYNEEEEEGENCSKNGAE